MANAVKTAPAKVLKLTNPRLLQNLSGYAYLQYVATPEAGVTLEQVLEPSYWADVANRIKPLSRIEVIPDDMSYFAYLVVIDVARNAAKVAVIHHTELSEVESEPAPEQFTVKFHGPHKKFAVLRKEDSSLVKDGFATKELAIRYARQHAKAFSA